MKIYLDTKEVPGSMVITAARHVEMVVLLFHKKADKHINVNVEFGDGDGKIPVGKIAEKAEEYRSNKKAT